MCILFQSKESKDSMVSARERHSTGIFIGSFSFEFNQRTPITDFSLKGTLSYIISNINLVALDKQYLAARDNMTLGQLHMYQVSR